MSSPIMPDQLDVATVRSLFLTAGLTVSDDAIHAIGGGTINETWAADVGDERYFLRIGVSDAKAAEGPSWMTSRGLLREERAFEAMPDLQHLLPGRVHADFSRQLIDRDWVVHRHVSGQPWGDVKNRLAPFQNEAIWVQLGDITHAIHSIGAPEFGATDDGVGQASWSGLVRWDVTGFRVDAERFGLPPEPFDRLIALVDREASTLDLVTQPRLIHSDLGERHVFISDAGDPRPHITGLIDFEFARFADPWSESIPVLHRLGSVTDTEYRWFLSTYGAEPTGREFDTQMAIYVLTALGWFVMDAHRQGNDAGVNKAMSELISRLDAEGA